MCCSDNTNPTTHIIAVCPTNHAAKDSVATRGTLAVLVIVYLARGACFSTK